MRASPAYWIALLLAVLMTLQSYMWNQTAQLTEISLDDSIEGRTLNKISFGVRSALASAVWVRIDSYMHMGDPIKMVVREGEKIVKEESMGVSWRMNKEIVTLLQFVTMLDPTFTDAQTALAEHLTRDRGRFKEGMGYLHQAILYNESNPKLYKLYGQAGEIYFQTKMYAPAKAYLEKAIGLYSRVLNPRNVGSEGFEEEHDRMKLRTYMAYLATSYFELRDWPNTYKWWNESRAFSPTNHISRWIRTWISNPEAKFDPEEYKDVETLPRTETERHRATDLQFEHGDHEEVWLEPEFPPQFYQKLGLLATVASGLFLVILIKRLW